MHAPLHLALALGLVLLIATPLAAQDCNDNGVPDATDIGAGTSMDCDLDGVPDECQSCADCDDNGLLDVCELGGNGLVGQYWTSDQDGAFTTRVGARIDPNIDFGFTDPPFPLLPGSDNFAVRWTGTITSTTAGLYTFYTKTDDGVRLWVDGVSVIDRWINQSPTEWSGMITLDAGTAYAIRMDYYESGGGEEARLSWEPPGGTRVIVPTEALTPMVDTDGNGVPDPCDAFDCNNNGVADALDVLDGTSLDCNGNCIPDECDVVPGAPLGYWRFENAGDPAADSGPSAFPGAVLNGEIVSDVPVSFVPRTSAFNTGAVQVGGDGYLLVSDGGALDMGGASITFEAWVRIDELSDTSGNGQRQWLLQKKGLTDGGANLDYGFLAQAGNLNPTIVYGNPGGGNQSGRELALLFGNGSDGWGIISNIEIETTGWHYVAAVFDAVASEATFIIDDQKETIPFVSQGHVTTGGPLLAGAHTNAAGDYNQFLRGAFDELRISDGVLAPDERLNSIDGADCNGNGVPDVCDLADGTATDCDGDGLLDECEPDCNMNGVPDGCDIIDGTSPDCDTNGVPDECQVEDDCDGNGIPDACDLAGGAPDCNVNGVIDSCDIDDGTSADCDGDGVPDECQLEETIDLAYDDGGAEFGVRADQTYTAWLTRFSAPSGGAVLDAIDAMFVLTPPTTNVNVYVWSDPNGDGDPTDASVLWSNSITVNQTNVLRRIQVPDLDVGDAGASFFLGFVLPNAVPVTDFPAPLDVSGDRPPGRSWLVGSNTPIDANDLSAGADEFRPIEEILFGGAWIIRAHMLLPGGDCNGNGVTDGCDIESGFSDDLDGNGVPDECEDCNGNGTLDSIDIAGGESADCNGDGVPDECQVLSNDCNGDGVPDSCQLAGNDCNDNGILDACDIVSGYAVDVDGSGVPDACEDCNANGVVDSMDIADLVSADCNADGVPDECQLGDPIQPVSYQYDDGTREINFGFVSPVDMAWLNHYTVEPGGEVITAIEVVWANTLAGLPAEVVLWSDPNGDGNPGDAQVIAIAATETMNVNTSVFNRVTIPRTFVGAAGTSFFAGVHFDDIYNTAPVATDTNDGDNESWLANAPNGTIDLNNLAGAFITQYGDDDFMVRAIGGSGALENDCNENLVLDQCDIDADTSDDVDENGIPDECECADANGDGVVNVVDLVMVITSWGSCTDCAADFNGDGEVDVTDLVAVILDWGVCPLSK